MKPADRARFDAHHEIAARARAGELTDVERAALDVLLDRILLAVMTDEEAVEHDRTPPWWRRTGDAYGVLLAAAVPEPRRVGGADVHRLPSATNRRA